MQGRGFESGLEASHELSARCLRRMKVSASSADFRLRKHYLRNSVVDEQERISTVIPNRTSRNRENHIGLNRHRLDIACQSSVSSLAA